MNYGERPKVVIASDLREGDNLTPSLPSPLEGEGEGGGNERSKT